MLTCPKCNAQLEDGAKFCDLCGAPIQAPAPEPVYCPHCGVQTGSETPFCQNCGKPLDEKIFCSNCGQQVNSSSTVCPNCSSKLYEEVFCPNCGTSAHPEATFCKKCGTSLKAVVKTEEPPIFMTDAKPEDKKPNIKIPKKGLIFGAAGIVIVAAIVCLFILLGGKGGSSKNYAMYIKDKEIYYTGFSKDDPWQVTSRLVDSNNYDNYELSYSSNIIGAACHLSEDGSLLFFPDKVSDYSDGYSLYYRNVNKRKEDAVKIDSDVIYYSVSKDASFVTYLKNDTLYQYDRKKDDKQKVASDIERYYVSDNGKFIIYLNSENALYSTEKGGERAKIDSDVSTLAYISEDLSLLFYIKDGKLYKKEQGKDKVKISSDVESVLKAYDSGEVYYVKGETVEVPLMNYVYDDKKEADAALTEPEAPLWSDPDYDTAYDAYVQAYDEYIAKMNRDYYRESLESEKMEQSNYTLCYYDGEDESTVNDAFTYSSFTFAADKPVIAYTAYDQDDDIGVKLSEIESIYDVNIMVMDALYSSAERYVAVGSSSTSIDHEEATGFRISADGKKLYFMDEIPEDKNYGELYQADISSSGEVGSAQVYDSDVYTDSLYLIESGRLIYFKDCKNDKAELYVDKEKVDYDVDVYSVRYDKDNDRVIYFTDWSTDKGYGTLKTYSKKSPEKISDDVHSFYSLSNGNMLYIDDYSQKYYHGDLYLWNKKEAEKIDDSVVCIIPIY